MHSLSRNATDEFYDWLIGSVDIDALALGSMAAERGRL